MKSDPFYRAMVSYGVEVFKGVHPRRWTPEQYEDFLSFQAFAILEAEKNKAKP
jgi:hypothetical protein